MSSPPPDFSNWFAPPRDLRKHDRHGRRKRVGVAGAGAAGLTAAYELGRLGHAVTVFEASGRTGGRVKTETFSGGIYGELGAMRLPKDHPCVHHLLRTLNIPTRPFITSSNRAFYHLRGVRCRIGDFRELASVFGFTQGFIPNSGDLYKSMMRTIWKSLAHYSQFELVGTELASELATYESQTLSEALAQRFNTKEQEIIFAAAGLGAYSGASFLETVLGYANYAEPEMHEVCGGLSRFSDALVENIPTGVRLWHQVTRIEVKRDSVRMGLKTPKGEMEDDFDAVICAVPPSAVKHIAFTPGLPTQKADALNEVNHVPASKTLAVSKRPFWRDEGILGGASHTDLAVQSIWYPSCEKEEEPSDGDQRAVFTAQYSRGEPALLFGQLTSREKDDAVLKGLDAVHRGCTKWIDKLVHQVWFDPATGGGGFCRLLPGQWIKHRSALVAPFPVTRPRVFFAGESYGVTHGWIEGALESAQRSVMHLLELTPMRE